MPILTEHTQRSLGPAFGGHVEVKSRRLGVAPQQLVQLGQLRRGSEIRRGDHGPEFSRAGRCHTCSRP